MEQSEGKILAIDDNEIGLIKCQETEELVEFDASDVEKTSALTLNQQVTFEIIQVAYVNRRVAINVKLKEE